MLLASGLSVPSASAATSDSSISTDVPSVPGTAGNHEPPPVDTSKKLTAPLPAPVLPAPGSAVVQLPADGSAVAAGTLPIRVAASAGDASPSAVRVTLLQQTTTAAVGGVGVAFVVTRADGGSAPGPVRLLLDYGAWSSMYGASFADRLDVSRIPLCGPLGPVQFACPVPTRGVLRNNDLHERVLEVAVQAVPAASADVPQLAAGPSASASPVGDPSASPSPVATSSTSSDSSAPVPGAESPAPEPSPSSSSDAAAALSVPDPLSDPGVLTVPAGSSDYVVNLPAKQDICAALPVGFALCQPDAFVSSLLADPSSPVTSNSMYAVAPTPSGSGGDATSIISHDHWVAGQQSGALTYSYPLVLPPSAAGATPSVSLGYSSQTVDGRTSARNNQASDFGMGWDYDPGYVERSYMPCSVQTTSSSTTLKSSGDLCWADASSDDQASSYSLTLGGQSGRLFQAPDGTFRLEDDPGWKIELAGSFWVVTTQDGTRYWFGYGTNGTGGTTATNATWNVPVFATKSGQCGWGGTGYCSSPWRWNLDMVMDTNGNTQFYYYTAATNYYKSLAAANKILGYTRGGALSAIEYGSHSSAINSTGSARVEFLSQYRCVQNAGGSGTCPVPSATAGQSYPDAPVDQMCSSTACTKTSPSFFDTTMTYRINTKVNTASGYTLVDQYTLYYSFPYTGSGQSTSYDQLDGQTPALWLSSITRNGADPDGGGASNVILPTVEFQPIMYNNRVDYDTSRGVLPMTMPRIDKVITELGEVIDPTYSKGIAAHAGETNLNTTGDPCTSSSLPSQTDNGRLCFPIWWAPKAGSAGWGWYFRYVVTDVFDGASPGDQHYQEWHYDYYNSLSSSRVLWNYDHDLSIKHHAFNDWRGFPRVTVTHGSSAATQTVEHSWYFTGLAGEPTLTNGTGSRSNTITSASGEVTNDFEPYAGHLIRHTLTNGPSTYASSDWHGYSWTSTAGTHGGYVRENDSRTTVPLGGGGTRTTRTVRTYDTASTPASGQLLTSYEYGAVDGTGAYLDSSHVRCTSIDYAENASSWILDKPWQVILHNGNCAQATIGWSQRAYDGLSVGTAPTKGNATRQLQYTTDSSHTQETGASYDSYGRTLSTYLKPASTYTTSTAYLNASGASATPCAAGKCLYPATVRVTDPRGLVTSATSFDNGRGLPTKLTDANGAVTFQVYDRLGRPSATYSPTESKTSGCPSVSHSYTLDTAKTNPAVELTQVLQSETTGTSCSGTFLPTYTFYDGWGRPVSTQRLAPNGGRLTVWTTYDDRGLKAGESQPYYNTSAPGTYLYPSVSAIPSRTVTTFDNAERPVAVSQVGLGVTKWTTTTQYLGDRVVVDPPVSAPTTTYYDDFGRVIKVEDPDGVTSPAPHVDYAYNRRGDLERVTDHSGSTTTNTYAAYAPLLLSTTSPDAGKLTTDYDGAGNITHTARWTTDATPVMVRELFYSYDEAQHLTAIRKDTGTGPLLRTWAYGGAGTGSAVDFQLGRLATFTAYGPGGESYPTVIRYDARGRAVSKSLTVPSSQPVGLAGTWNSAVGYDKADHVTTQTYPAGPSVAGLDPETVSSSYTTAGYPNALTSGLQPSTYVSSTVFRDDGPLRGRWYAPTTGVQYKRVYDYTSEEGMRLNRIRTIKVAVGGAETSLQDDSLLYDAEGDPLEVHDTVPGQEQYQCFSYDGAMRLKHAWTAASACSTNPAYNPTAGQAPYEASYTYDAGKDALATASLTSGASPAAVSSYAYAAVQPHAASSISTTGIATPVGLSYDPVTGAATGRTDASGSTTLAWDYLGQLSTASTPSGSSSNVYDVDGSRLLHTSTTAGLTTSTLYLDGEEITVKSNGDQSALRYYTSAGAQVAARSYLKPNGGTTTSTLSWLMNDRANSAQLTIDNTSGTTRRQQYTPFGAHRGATTLPISRDFLNKVRDPDTGLNQLGARYYDATVGLFLSPDPLTGASGPASLNPYNYATNNPLRYMDPSGLMQCSTQDEAGTCAGQAYTGSQSAGNASRAGASSASNSTQSREDADARCAYMQCGLQHFTADLATAARAGDTWGGSTPTLRQQAMGLLGVLALNDIRDCGHGSASGCAFTAAMLIPGIGKILGLAGKEAIRGGRALFLGRRAEQAAEDGLGVLSGATRTNVDDAIERAAVGKVRFPGHDGKPYLNSDGLLPEGVDYTEWTAAEAGAKRGADRVIIGGDPANPSAIYYWDHVNPPVRIR